jgi:putative Holliday junction resolvase
MARLLALDVGDARIGVAVCDALGMLASPYETLHVTRDEEQTRRTIRGLIDELGAEGLVVGLPISLDGQLHAQGARVQAFAERLRPYITVPLVFWDERLSTVEAQRLLAERGESAGSKGSRRGRTSGRGHQQQGQRRRHKGHEIDALAAAVILQDYLDHPGNKTGEETL